VIRNGWQLFFRVFKAALDEMETQVADLAARDPRGYKSLSTVTNGCGKTCADFE
jgi:hypothetical protein